MREKLIPLLKELNKAYPEVIPIRTLKENGHEIAVINDAIKGKLVESDTVLSLGDPKFNNKEMALKLSIKGYEFMKDNNDNSTVHKGDTKIEITGSDNIVGLGQSHSQVKIDKPKEKIQKELVLPRHNFEDTFLTLGEKLLKIVSGSLENGIFKVRILSVLIMLSNIFALGYIFWKNILSLILPLAIILAFIIVIFGSLIGYSSEDRRCSKCNKYYAYRTVKKTMLGEGEYKGQKIYNIKEIDKCRFCGNEEIFKFTETDARGI